MISAGVSIPSDWQTSMPAVATALSAASGMRPQVSDVHFHQDQQPWCRQGAVLAPMTNLTPVDHSELESVFAWIGKCPRVDWQAGNNATTTVCDVEGKRWQATGYNEINGLSAVFSRLQDMAPPLEQLGLPGEIRRLAAQLTGLVIATGPARSGRSTTVASLLEFVNQTRQSHILIIEHPTEFLHKSRLSLVSHRDIDSAGRNSILSTVLNSDPDVVLIGESKTAEDFWLCLTLAAAGRLVFTTMHAPDSTGACERIAAATGPNGQMLLSQVLQGVIAQRRLPDASDPRGCYVIAEALMMTSALRLVLKPGNDMDVLRSHLRDRKMTIDHLLVEKCLRGEITEASARGASVDPETFDSWLHQSLLDQPRTNKQN